MNTANYFRRLALLFLAALAFASVSLAQTSKPPQQEKLLNGLKLLMWNEPTADKVTIKLRIHSGAEFDTLNKEGTMALLGDILFPNEAVKEYFRDDLGGSLEVVSNYDYIQINATGNTDQIITILETISNAVTKPAIDKDTTAKVRAARIERVKELEKKPSYLADQAVAKRLLGDFPYGKSAEGTSESLAKIDFADLLLAKQRFLTADNATLAVSSSVKTDAVFKAVRQLFGGWEKADKKVPATFAEPPAPDTKFFLIKTEINNASELRFAFRGGARGDKDFYAAQILSRVLQNRLRKKEGEKVVLQQNSYLLPGLVILKFSDWDNSVLKASGADISLPENFLNYVQDLLKPNVTADEFESAKSDVLKNFTNQNSIDTWLDADTFRLVTKTDAAAAQNAALTDAQKVLERWRNAAVVKTLFFKASV